MNNTNKHRIRPNFLGTIFIVIGVVTLLGGFYTIGLWLPLFIASSILFLSNSENILEILPVKTYQLVFFLVVTIGFLVNIFFGFLPSISWYFVAFILSMSFKAVRHIFTILGFAGIFTNT